MKTIVVASKNPVKIRAVGNGFVRMFPNESFKTHGLSVPSGVSEQPRSEFEAFEGALNRARNAAKMSDYANYCVGVEGGIEEQFDGMIAFAWIVILSDMKIGKARTGGFYLPNPVAKLIHQGMELGEADDIIFDRENSKTENGAIGLLTQNVIDRTQLYEQAVILALLPFKNPTLYD